MEIKVFRGLILWFALIALIPQLRSQEYGNIAIDKKLMDSLDVEISIGKKSGDLDKATQAMFQKGKLMFGYGMYANAIGVLNTAIDVLEKGDLFKKSKSLKDIYIDCINHKGGAYCYMADYNDALDCYIKIDKINNGVDTMYSIKSNTGMGMVFAMSGNDKVAEGYCRKTLQLAKHYKKYIPFPIYSNMGYLFLKRKEFDSALNYFLEAQKLAVKMKDRGKEMTNLLSLGNINSDMGKYSLALNYYKEAASIAKEQKNYSELTFITYNLIDVYIALGDLNSAMQIAEDALALSQTSNSKSLEVGSLRKLSALYREQGDFRRSLECLEESIIVGDSIFNSENEERLLKQRTDFELYRAQSEEDMAEKDNALNEANRKINNIIVILVIVILVTLTIILSRVLIRQYKINSQLSNKLEYDETQRTQLQDEIEQQSRELTSNSLLFVKITEQSYLLNSKLRILKSNLSLKSKEQELIKEMEEIINQFVPNKSWDEFKQYFDKVSPDFYDRLDILYPELTNGEKRMCALISLGLSTKEISSLTGKTSGAVDSIKFRIRRKMNIEADINLSDIFLHLK